MLRFYKLGSKYKADKIHALLALCTDSGETGRICELLAVSDNITSKHDPNSVWCLERNLSTPLFGKRLQRDAI
jgi:hypothetical protein